jgi:hypothetical protein
MKPLIELTADQAKEILEFALSNSDWIFSKISIEPDDPNQLTFEGKRCIGIEYHFDQDTYILPFNDSKVVLWLYQNGFEILDYLIENQNDSQSLADFDDLAFEVFCLSKGTENFSDNFKHNWSLDFVKQKCENIYKKYYLKN